MPIRQRGSPGNLALWFLLLLTLAMANAEDWQKKAVQMYPQLGVSDSAFSKTFKLLEQQYKTNNPAFFQSPQWPVLLAKECAAQLASEANPKSPPSKAPAAPAAAPPMDPNKALLIAKCGRCHDTPDPTVEEMTWNRWMWKWRFKANLTDDEYYQLMDYARGQRDAAWAKLKR